MAKIAHYNVEVKEIKRSKTNKILSETVKESHSNVTRHNLQMLIGKFAIEHPECAVFDRKKDGYYVSVEIWTCDKDGIVTQLACMAKEVAE